MEALLRHLNNYGMVDLSFIIVNSREPRSRATIEKLTNRVSFPVYQETEEEQVWNVLEGGKDDMYVYDRCGRLTYFIPFPLSIIHEDQPIVQAAVLSTYFQSPCGLTCSENSTFSINALDEDIPEEAIQHSNASTEHVTVEDDFMVAGMDNSTATDGVEATTKSTLDYVDISENFTTPEDNNTIDTIVLSYDDDNITQIEESDNYNTTNTLKDVEPTNPSILSSLLKFIIGSYEPHSEHSKEESSMEGTSAINEVDSSEKQDKTNIDSHHDHDIQGNVQDPSTEITESNDNKRCLGFDENVCREWSKRKLLQAQRCCASLTDLGGITGRQHHQTLRSCKNYGKKRCTKMQPIFKCCMKTGMKLEETGKDEERTQKEM